MCGRVRVRSHATHGRGCLNVALSHQNIENNAQRKSKIKPFIRQYNWKEIDFPSHSKDWKKLKQLAIDNCS